MDIEKLLKENEIDMSVEEFTGYTKKVSIMCCVLNRLEIFFRNIFLEVAASEDSTSI